MSTTIIQKRRAVSPVIATVILIAVAVALGIAVAFWASGLTSSFSKYEKLGVSTQYATGSKPTWNVYLGGQNTGSSDASITQIQVNGVPVTASNITKACNVTANSCNPAPYLPLSVPSGAAFNVTLQVSGSKFADGQTIQVTIITAAGNNYPASIVLP
jgi:flagellin-like protein